jgi:hypothetical protein
VTLSSVINRSKLSMHIAGVEHIQAFLDRSASAVKVVFNTNCAIFFPASEQHRDQKAPGISYEDDYQGNALAGTLFADRIEIRFHRGFSEAQVANLLATLASQPGLSLLQNCQATYQGRAVPSSPNRG